MSKGSAAPKLQSIKGVHDILPEQTAQWQHLEAIIHEVLQGYGYREIRLPIMESTELFRRSIGEVTDIVEKEMYTFSDSKEAKISLRPEGTAGCLRACLQHGLLHRSTQRLWYQGPMFRRERPQKDRYRQFYQIGVEAYGFAGPDIDAELILLSRRIWRKLGLEGRLELQLNSLGSSAERQTYKAQLVTFFKAHESALDADSVRRLATNPLRILDSKNPAMRELIAAAPTLDAFLGAQSQAHFQQLCALLEQAEVRYKVNPYLVRGLDYYSRTVFEWVSDELGAQATVCAGGRYDGLVEQLGGHTSFAMGFAMGLERLLSLWQSPPEDGPACYVISQGEAARSYVLQWAETLRDRFPRLGLISHCGEGSFKSQFKQADRAGARLALVVGEDELRDQQITIKPLRGQGAQQTIPRAELEDFLQKWQAQ